MPLVAAPRDTKAQTQDPPYRTPREELALEWVFVSQNVKFMGSSKVTVVTGPGGQRFLLVDRSSEGGEATLVPLESASVGVRDSCAPIASVVGVSDSKQLSGRSTPLGYVPHHALAKA